MKDKNDQRALLAILMCLAVFTVWSYFFGPAPEETAPEPAVAVAPAAAPVVVSDVVAVPCVGEPRRFQTDAVELAVDGCRGGVSEIRVSGQSGSLTVTPWWTWIWNQAMSRGSAGAWHPYVEASHDSSMLSESGRFATAGVGEPGRAGVRTVVPGGEGVTGQEVYANGVTMTTVFSPTKDPDLFTLSVHWETTTPAAGPFWVGMDDAFRDIANRTDSAVRLEAVTDGSLNTLSAPHEVTEVKPLEGPVSWFGVADRYFLAVVVPDDPSWGRLSYRPSAEGRVGAYLYATADSLQPGSPLDATFQVYLGPKDVERLSVVGHDLEEAASLGWFGFFSKILLFVLHIFHAGLGNWGLAIISLTFFVRLLLYPIAARGFRSAKAMQLVQPELKALQEKFADDKEAQSRETMALFQRHGVNPVGGCLPIVFQMPVFFALYSALNSTPDLYHSTFLYIRDLSMPDPLGIFPALMAVGMVLQQRMTPMTGMDPTQQQMMKFMPLMFALFMFGVPSGLSLYYVINTGLTILQQWYNTRSWEAHLARQS